MNIILFALTIAGITGPQVEVDLSAYDAESGVVVWTDGTRLRAEWASDNRRDKHAVVLRLDPHKPLLASVAIGSRVIVTDMDPQFSVTTGERKTRKNNRYIFFDKPSDGKTERHVTQRAAGQVRVESAGQRTTIILPGLHAGVFTGDLRIHIYSGSPLLHFEARMAPSAHDIAYIYDFVLEGRTPAVVWKDNYDRWQRTAPRGTNQPVHVRNRTIMGAYDQGTLAIFPPPHAFFFPRDYSDNFGFAQVGENQFGLRQDPSGGPGHRGAYVPWIDAPGRKFQRMGAFVMLSAKGPRPTLERVKRYTHGDRYKKIPGRVTLTSHWHMHLTADARKGKRSAADAVRIFKEKNVNIVHLAEFHGDGSPWDTGERRLRDLDEMFKLCRRYSDPNLLLIPGEEANAHLNEGTPKGIYAGHWLYMFPKPVFLTLKSELGQAFIEDHPKYGRVYHPHNEDEMVRILSDENALGWTAHPRIKASFATPDYHRDRDWYKSDMWLGGAWKAMPAELSTPRLGVRVLDLLDDMNTWGQRKVVLGEVDVFDIDKTHALYAHMNVNYLKMDKVPSFDDWSSVLKVLRKGDFFVSTGEVLIHKLSVGNGTVHADIEWTFPLEQVELVMSDGKKTFRRTIPMARTREFGRQSFSWADDLTGMKWVRIEAWDVAFNGAFTQPLWLDP